VKKTISLIIFIFIVAGLVSALQEKYDSTIKNTSTPIEDFKYLPSGKFLKGAALSFDEILADLLWIKAIGYFGGHYHTDKNFQWLKQILNVTTTLDPYFDDPYEFGGIVLAAELRDVDGSIAILKKGMRHVPKHHKRYWYLPFYTAFNYMYYKGDYKTAAHYMEIAASFPQRPAYLPLLVSRLYANTDDPGIAIPFLEKMKERAASSEMRDELDQRIKEIRVKQHILLLTRARDSFKAATGIFPRSVEQLFEKGFIKEIPTDPFGGRYYLDKADHSIRSSSNTDNLQLHINKKTPVPLTIREKEKNNHKK